MQLTRIIPWVLVLLLLALPGVGWAQEKEDVQAQIQQLKRQMAEMKKEYTEKIHALEKKIEELTATKEEGELEALRRAAEAEAATKEVEEEKPEEVTFKSGAMGLQSLNPEISVTGDMISSLREQRGVRKRSDFNFRTLGLHFESYLDPYSRFKAAVPITPAGAELGEAYLTRYGVGKDLNLTVGKFRQQLGVVNRWHKHGLDQVDFPLALQQIFGPGGLNQTGISLDWLLPQSGNASQELTLQITNGENPRLFGGNARNFPCTLAHYKNYRDLSKDKYLEFGLSALAGRNDQWQVQPGLPPPVTWSRDLWTTLLGADLTLLWEPTERMRYRNWVWRTEAYFLNRGLLAPDGSGKDTLRAWGAYSYFQKKTSRTLEVGIRADYYRPAVKAYAAVPGLSLSPLAVTRPGSYRWQISPYFTWYQSPWVHWRLEYDHQFGKGMGPDDRQLMLQCIFAAGPHKHERY